jgi:cytochrome c biogenesis protein CcdA
MPETLAYAFTLGLVGALNPCGFPLLPAYLALFIPADGPQGTRLLRALGAGACLTLGFVAVFTALGLAAGAAVSAALAFAPWLMLAVAAALILLGAAALAGRAPAWRAPALAFRAGTGAVAMIGFGAAYALGSLSCSLPLFLSGVSGAFAADARAQGIGAFLAYGLGMGLFVTGASVAAALAGAGAVRALRGAVRVLPRIAGGACALVGTYLLAYWLHALIAPESRLTVIIDAQAVQAAVARWVSAAALPIAAGLGLAVAGAFVALALHARKDPTAQKETSG